VTQVELRPARSFLPEKLVAACVVIGVVTFVTYRASLEGRLFFDDRSSIEQNGHVFALADPKQRWTIDGWLYAASAPQDTPFAGRPVVSLSFALNHWWASAMRPSGMADFWGVLEIHFPYFHYVNLALHIAAACLIFLLARRTLLSPALGDKSAGTAFYWAFLLALVWAVHPLNTETVVYVTQRTEQLMSLFLLIMLLAGSKALDAATWEARLVWQGVAVAACALGMGSKENMIAAPLLAVAYDRAFRFETFRSALRERWGYYSLLAAGWLWLAAIMLGAPRGSSVGFAHTTFTWYDYLITQCWCLGRYAWLSILPLGGKLCVDYGRRAVLDPIYVAPGALVIAAAVATTMWGWFRKPWIGFVGTWFFFILAPTSSFVPIVTEVGAERRMYLPVLAVLCAFVALLQASWRRLGLADFAESLAGGRKRAAKSSRSWNGAILCGVVLLVGLLAYTSHERNKVYRDPIELYGHIARVFPDNERGLSNYAKILIDNGLFEQALELLNRAVSIDPQYSDALSNRGFVSLRTALNRRLDVAIACFTEALNWSPGDLTARNNRGYTFSELKLYDRAREDFTAIIAVTSGYTEGYVARAALPIFSGETDDKSLEAGLGDIDVALLLNPYSYRAYLIRAELLTLSNRPDDALAAAEESLENFRRESSRLQHQPAFAASLTAAEYILSTIDAQRRQLPRHLIPHLEAYPFRDQLGHLLNIRADAYRLRSQLTGSRSDRQAALDDFTRAIVLEPRDPQHLIDRGEIYLEAGRLGEALLDFNQALALDANSVKALAKRAEALLRSGDMLSAWADAKRLRDLGSPLDDALLETLRQKSGHDYP